MGPVALPYFASSKVEAVIQIERDHVAEMLGVTPRYVHLLLEETGKSCTHHVLERASKGRPRCADPRWRYRKIADIAAEAGFAELSYSPAPSAAASAHTIGHARRELSRHRAPKGLFAAANRTIAAVELVFSRTSFVDCVKISQVGPPNLLPVAAQNAVNL